MEARLPKEEEPPSAPLGKPCDGLHSKQRPAAPKREPAENVVLCLESVAVFPSRRPWLGYFSCAVVRS